MTKVTKFKKIIFITFTLFFLNYFYAETKTVDYYGVFSPDADKNMLKMTEDLFFTQLSEMDFTLNDKRSFGANTYSNPEEIDYSSATKNSLSFFVEIKREGDALSKWLCVISIKDNDSSSISNFKKEYDSYYKILMDSKTSVKKIFANLDDNQNMQTEQNRENQNNENTSQKSASVALNKTSEKETIPVSQDSLIGIWAGENFIDKIIIMKGGRGFIILKNGASMSVQVNIQTDDDGEKYVYIKQISHSNASYFPELPRETALEAAMSASPIEYKLKLTDKNVLEGTKTTLVLENENGKTVQGNINVTWHKTN